MMMIAIDQGYANKKLNKKHGNHDFHAFQY